MPVGSTAERQRPADVAARLNGRVEDLVRDLLGKPNAELSSAAQLRFGRKGSIAVELQGEKRGQWFDHEDNVGGDCLTLIQRQMKLEMAEACRWALDWLGSDVCASPSPSRREAGRRDAAATGRLAGGDPQKVEEIVRGSIDPAGTPADTYLAGRGVVRRPLPDSIRFRAAAHARYGALVALATDDAGSVRAVQQIYVTDAGVKAPLQVGKRTNKADDRWTETSAVRLPGSRPVVLAEGVETALSIWQSTGRETWACLGIANIGRAPVPQGAVVVVARDGDAPGSKADAQVRKAVELLATRGCVVLLAEPPLGLDMNDVLQAQGQAAVLALIADARAVAISRRRSEPKQLQIGSDVEIAHGLVEDLEALFGRIVHAEGNFWRFRRTHWEPIPERELRAFAHEYDGASYRTAGGDPARIKLGKSRIDSILHEATVPVADPEFFSQMPAGINCASGFLRFTDDGSPILEEHDPDRRCRHTLPGHWQDGASGTPPAGSLLHRLLDGMFRDDPDAAEKIMLLAEMCGAAALGHATRLRQPRAIVLKGERAENGKSQVLDLARGLLPPSAVCSVTAARMGDERHVIGLVGKLLNACDELSSSGAIASETFKAIVTGEPVDGRDVYRSRIEFRPVAQHLFATNTLPSFQGGIDRGVQRRLLVVTFNRVIPLEERVEAIGRRIATDEPDLLLAWAVEGASRLIRKRNFTMPPSSKLALREWMYQADPVLAWIAECVDEQDVVDPGRLHPTRVAYQHFRTWALAEGYRENKLPAINAFTQRVVANARGVESHRTGKGRFLRGLKLVSDPGE